ncbi:MAG: hypothetical protein KDE00_00855 [Rhodobacteraceae bacterium]|nr:hypothetical protein [Paracoccaceae bacterium]
MTTTTRLYTLNAILLGAALFAGAPASAQSVTVTGSNGSTVQTDRDCNRVAGQATCTRNSTATGARGQTGYRSVTRVTGGGKATTTINGMGPGGQTTSRTRVLTVTR